MNTCLYWDGTVLVKEGYKSEFIIDILEGNIFAEAHGPLNPAKRTEEHATSEREFTALRKQLFVESNARLAELAAEKKAPKK